MSERDEAPPVSLAPYPGLWRLATTLEVAAAGACWALAIPPWSWLHALQARLVPVPSPLLSFVALFLLQFLLTCGVYVLVTGPERKRRGMSLDEAARLHELAPWGAHRAGQLQIKRIPQGVILTAMVLTGAGLTLDLAQDPAAAEAQRQVLVSAGAAFALLALAILGFRIRRDRSTSGMGETRSPSRSPS